MSNRWQSQWPNNKEEKFPYQCKTIAGADLCHGAVHQEREGESLTHSTHLLISSLGQTSLSQPAHHPLSTEPASAFSHQQSAATANQSEPLFHRLWLWLPAVGLSWQASSAATSVSHCFATGSLCCMVSHSVPALIGIHYYNTRTDQEVIIQNAYFHFLSSIAHTEKHL